VNFKNYEIGQISIRDNLEGLKVLHAAHYEETEHKYKHHTVNVNYEHFMAVEAKGQLFCFGAHTVDSKQLCAYLFTYLSPSAHDTSMIATADMFFLSPEHRGSGVARRLLQVAQDRLKEKGADYMIMTDKSPLGAPHLKMLFESEGYAQMAIAYSKAL